MIRTATPDDLPAVRELWRAFETEIPDAPHRDSDSERGSRPARGGRHRRDRRPRRGGRLRAGRARALHGGPAIASRFLDLLYVRPERANVGCRSGSPARGGLAAARGRRRDARARGARVERRRADDLRALGLRAGRADARRAGGVAREAARAADRSDVRLDPRADGRHGCGRAGACRSSCRGWGSPAGRASPGRATAGSPSTTSCATASPDVVRRLAKELSYALRAVALAIGVEDGAYVWYTLYDMGGDVDEYASVPEYHGELPPGDVVALGANPTVVARLTGADARAVRDGRAHGGRARRSSGRASSSCARSPR